MKNFIEKSNKNKQNKRKNRDNYRYTSEKL